MDVQEFFQSFDFCLKVLGYLGIVVNKDFCTILMISLNFICLIGSLIGAIWSSFLEVDEILKTAVKIFFIVSLSGIIFKLIKLMAGIEKIKNMKEKTKVIFEKLKEKSEIEVDKAIKHELKFVDKIFKILFTVMIFPLTCFILIMPFLEELPLLEAILYPFDLENMIWFKTATLHQIYCHFFISILFICNNYLLVIFISYSVGFLSAIHKQLYYKVGQGREKVFIDCMKSYKMVKKLVDDVKEHFEFILLFQLIFNAIVIGFMIFIIFESGDIKLGLLLIFS